MSTVTFVSGSQSAQEYNLVKIGVTTREGVDRHLDLIAVPLYANPWRPSRLISVCQSISTCLADSSSSDTAMEVDILIGSDYYWDFSTGVICCGDSGPVVIHTSLGWVLSGAVPVVTDQNSSLSFLVTHAFRIDAPTVAENLDEVLHSFWNLESRALKNLCWIRSHRRYSSRKVTTKLRFHGWTLIPHFQITTNWAMNNSRVFSVA